MKFLCDAMLGKLCRWLRILGYDTVLAPESASDEEVIALAEDRVILTRDKEVAALHDSLFIPDNDLRSQLALVIKEFNLEPRLSPERCSLCNGQLKESVTLGGKGWKCVGCGQEYWQGSHWERMKEFLKTLT